MLGYVYFTTIFKKSREETEFRIVIVLGLEEERDQDREEAHGYIAINVLVLDLGGVFMGLHFMIYICLRGDNVCVINYSD